MASYKINENNDLIITIPLQKATLSKSRRSFIVATTNGFDKTGLQVGGKEVQISINAIINK